MDAICDNLITSDSNGDEMLILNDCLSMKKEVTYKLYVQLFEKLTAKEELICKVITKLAKDQLTADSAAGEGVTGVFKATPPKKEVNNIVFGSSIAAKLAEDKSLPHDFSVHAYRGSTTKEKLKNTR